MQCENVYPSKHRVSVWHKSKCLELPFEHSNAEHCRQNIQTVKSLVISECVIGGKHMVIRSFHCVNEITIVFNSIHFNCCYTDFKLVWCSFRIIFSKFSKENHNQKMNTSDSSTSEVDYEVERIDGKQVFNGIVSMTEVKKNQFHCIFWQIKTCVCEKKDACCVWMLSQTAQLNIDICVHFAPIISN